jgi:hypothetical protein
MAIKSVVLGKQTTSSTGTALTLIAAPVGYRNFSDTLATGDTCYYYLKDANGADWEYGIGTLDSLSPDVFSRAATPLMSSNAGASITLSSGTHTLRCVDYPGKLVPENVVIGGNDVPVIDFLGGEIFGAVTPHYDGSAMPLNMNGRAKLIWNADLSNNKTIDVINMPDVEAEIICFIKSNGFTVTFSGVGVNAFNPTGISPAIPASGNYIIHMWFKPSQTAWWYTVS